MATNPAIEAQHYGQSIWLDYIHRDDLTNGTMQRYIDAGVLGVTSNPTIFQQAIGGSQTYDETIRTMLDLDANTIYEHLAVADIQAASDLFLPIYQRTGGRDGYVSMEVSPLIAQDTDATIAEAKRLYAAVDRPNLMVKIPATDAGIPAIEASIAAGININVTLIFSVGNYERVAGAYIRGLERRLEAGESVDTIASVASFFLSRIDAAVDRILQNNIRTAQVHGDTGRIATNRRLLGQAAIANAKLAYRSFQRIFVGSRFKHLREAGAQVQRPLWASSGTKNSAYPDTMYVDTLIGRDTVNTLPPKTLAAFIDHGKPTEDAILRDGEAYFNADEVMDRLSEVGINMEQVTQRLQADGVDVFIEAFETLIEQVAAKRITLATGIQERQKLALGTHADAVNHAVRNLDANLINERIWSRDGSLWKNNGPIIARIQQRLGWLDVLASIDLERLKRLQNAVKDADFTHVLLLGMGGSSLAPDVMMRTFGDQPAYPRLHVLDSTDPQHVRATDAALDIARTLFIVSSKSGTTVETLAFFKYFWQRTGGKSEQFLCITDPDTPLAQMAQAYGFRDTFLNPPDIGGRYSALSYFGMVPAALMGLDLDRAWRNARIMIEACGETIPGELHPGLTLGAVIGAIGKAGRDKVSVVATHSMRYFGDWVEQLMAESIGKQGKGLIPIVGATVGKPHDHSTDRQFIYLRVDDDTDIEETDASVRALREAGHPRVTMRLPDTYALFGEFFRWEYAVAIAGHIYDVNPFDEPNVTESKEATKAILERYAETGELPHSEPFMSGERTRLYSNEATLAPMRELCRAHGYNPESRTELLAAQLAGMQSGDYIAILAYLPPNAATDAKLRQIQRRMRHVTRRVVTVGYGPRYLHSTGQLHKGGPGNGVYIMLTKTQGPEVDLDIPGEPYSFGTLITAQAIGDMQVLEAHNRRVMRIHIEGDVQAGIDKLLAAIEFVETRRH
jgi:transaldolase / glucose-6-phosphate isomerase